MSSLQNLPHFNLWFIVSLYILWGEVTQTGCSDQCRSHSIKVRFQRTIGSWLRLIKLIVANGVKIDKGDGETKTYFYAYTSLSRIILTIRSLRGPENDGETVGWINVEVDCKYSVTWLVWKEIDAKGRRGKTYNDRITNFW